MNQPQSPQTPADHLTRLTPRIRGAAHNLAHQYNADPEDVQQEIVLAILERYAGEPDFLNQTAAYIVNHGAWRARDAIRRELTIHVNRELPTSDLADPEASDDLDKAALFAADPWPALSLSMAVERALATLSDENRRIARGLAAGYTTREISTSVGLSIRTVYYRMRGPIAQALAGCTNSG